MQMFIFQCLFKYKCLFAGSSVVFALKSFLLVRSMPDSSEKRVGIYKLRLLILESVAQAVKNKFGNDIAAPKLENEVMKIVRRRWNAQTEEIKGRLMKKEDVPLEALIPDAHEAAAVEPADDDAVVEMSERAAPPADEGDKVGGEDVELDGLLQKCLIGPKAADRERAIKAYVAEHRSELMGRVYGDSGDCQSRDNAVRKLGREEFDELCVDEQWSFLEKGLKQGSGRGARGQFVAAAGGGVDDAAVVAPVPSDPSGDAEAADAKEGHAV